jgi:hypothetical protein
LEPCDGVAVVPLLLFGKDLTTWAHWLSPRSRRSKRRPAKPASAKRSANCGSPISLVVPIPCAIAIAGDFFVLEWF